jgi:hypothetical protein
MLSNAGIYLDQRNQALEESPMKVLLPFLPESSMPTLISQRKTSQTPWHCISNGMSLLESSSGNEMRVFALGVAHVDGCTKDHACRNSTKRDTGPSKASIHRLPFLVRA